MNPFLKDQLAERELLSRFNTLIASEQDRQRMAAISAAYPPGKITFRLASIVTSKKSPNV